MRPVGSIISNIQLWVIHMTAVQSSDVNEFLSSLGTNEDDFNAWCDAVSREHQTTMTFELLKQTTREQLNEQYFPKRNYPLQKKLSEIHAIFQKYKSIKPALNESGFPCHRDFYRALAEVTVTIEEGRCLTHVDLFQCDIPTLSGMVGAAYDKTLVTLKQEIEKPAVDDISRINLVALKKLITFFTKYEEPITISMIAAYSKTNSDSLKKYLTQYKEGKRSLDFDTLVTCDLEQLQKRFVKPESAYHGKGKVRAQRREDEQVLESFERRNPAKKREATETVNPHLPKVGAFEHNVEPREVVVMPPLCGESYARYGFFTSQYGVPGLPPFNPYNGAHTFSFYAPNSLAPVPAQACTQPQQSVLLPHSEEAMDQSYPYT